ncbi:two-component sensor histidine kinase [Nonomuraea cavernae]|uniref:histidine kinase n=1 Tax=Nonomuraea cavernae TaxID=2045107 RepID=A0A917Z2N5_9ACTN|nr:two-component sensor histidine kinase [Nonomuraea cavernae]
MVSPFALALLRGEADPPSPRSRRLDLPVPRRLRVIAPFQRLDLVVMADLLLTWVLFGVVTGDVIEWNASVGEPLWEGLIYVAAGAVVAPVALRDRWPLAAWRTAVVLAPFWIHVGFTITPAGDMPYPAWAAIMYLLVLYSVSLRCDRRITFAAWTITVLALWIIQPNSMIVGTVMVTVAVLFGYNVRVRRTATAKLVEEEHRTQVAESAQAVLAERARIARELHDIVAHHMSVIAIQAEAVPLEAAGDPARLEAGLAEIRALSLAAIAELRQVLGVLRDQDGRTDTAPLPGLDRIDDLVAHARSAGLAVLIKRPGSLDGLPPAVGLSAYRILQESLSNAMRHAPGATVAVDVARDDHDLRLRVANGPGETPGGAPGAGQGLAGMRERAALLGGVLEAGPTKEGGFQVTARLPIAGAEETT